MALRGVSASGGCLFPLVAQTPVLYLGVTGPNTECSGHHHTVPKNQLIIS